MRVHVCSQGTSFEAYMLRDCLWVKQLVRGTPNLDLLHAFQSAASHHNDDGSSIRETLL